MAREAEDDALTTSLQPRHSHVNHAELPVLACGFDRLRQNLLIADVRDLRLLSGTQQISKCQVPSMPQGSSTSVMAIHHNAKGDFFVLIYASAEVRLCTPQLEVHAEANLNTRQSSILSSCWLEGRQELVTSGSDGSIRWFSTVRHYTTTTKGRKLLSKLVPRMTVRARWLTARSLYECCCCCRR